MTWPYSSSCKVQLILAFPLSKGLTNTNGVLRQTHQCDSHSIIVKAGTMKTDSRKTVLQDHFCLKIEPFLRFLVLLLLFVAKNPKIDHLHVTFTK